MKFSFLLLVLLTIGCSGANEQVDTQLDYKACSQPNAQKVLTFCASPKAAAGVSALAAVHQERLSGKSGDDLGPIPIGDSPVIGPKDAPVTIVMFTDLECPYCVKAHEELQKVLKARPDDIRVVFKHAPLPFHQNAVPAAVGAIAAGEQGKFWEFADLAYHNQDALSIPELPALAEKLGLDLEKFKAAFEHEGSLDPIRADLGLAQSLGVRGTPTFFVNGVREVGALDEAYWNERIDGQIELRKWLINSGVEAEDLYWRLATLNYQAVEVEESEEPPEAPAPPAVVGVPTEGAPAMGAEADVALVTIVEFSDFECPFCRKGAEVMHEVLKKYPDVRLTFRHFPLEFHEHAVPAAVISTLAQEKGVFWAYHDALFASEALSREALLEIAKKAGLSEEDVNARLSDKDAVQRVVSDMKLAQSVGVTGTPTFFVNGIRIGGAQPVEVFSALIDAQLEIAKKLQEKGLKGEQLYQALVVYNEAAVAAQGE